MLIHLTELPSVYVRGGERHEVNNSLDVRLSQHAISSNSLVRGRSWGTCSMSSGTNILLLFLLLLFVSIPSPSSLDWLQARPRLDDQHFYQSLPTVSELFQNLQALKEFKTTKKKKKVIMMCEQNTKKEHIPDT